MLVTAATADHETRSRMLAAASRLLQMQGYHGTGLSQILAVAEAPRGSMYHHFPGGKEQLAVEALTASQAWVTRAVERAFARGGGDARRGVREFIDAFAQQLETTDFAEGCPFATVALESTALPKTIRRACKESYAAWHALFASHLARSMNVQRAYAMATLVLAAIEGALVLSKASRSAAPLRSVGKELDALLAS
ncbi:MAG: TetR/AcrR family transcriptional regulator [Actinomycetota bacterium]|nr:TetR/AcrR family transcriptional regulator [Actinomycetota bacterium]